MEKLSRREQERQAREFRMIEAAERLFMKRGFDSVSMDEVARESQFTKRTLYQYFNNKEDLYFAVALKGFRKMSDYGRRGFEKGRTGFEKLHQGILAYYQFSLEHPETFRLISYTGPLIRKTEKSPKLKEWLAFDDRLFRSVGDVIEMGRKDGSIRLDIDPMQGTFSIIFISTGFLRLLAETGTNFAAHFGLDLETFSKDSISLMLDSFRPLGERKL